MKYWTRFRTAAFSLGFLFPSLLFASDFGSAEVDPAENLANSLRVATREGRVKEVQRLLTEGADPNRSGQFGETALMNAARYGQSQIVDLLLDHRAEVNARDSSDQTALQAAAKNCAPRVGAKLIAQGADVNWFNSEGKTALIIAADNGCADLVQAILRVRGVKLDLKDNNGSTALDYALTEAQAEVGGRYTDIVKMLRKAGAKSAQWQIPAASETLSQQAQAKQLP